MEHILSELKRLEITLARFLYVLFAVEDDGKPLVRSKQHEQSIVALMNGSANPWFIRILDLIYANAVAVNNRKNDETWPDNFTFTAGRSPKSFAQCSYVESSELGSEHI